MISPRLGVVELVITSVICLLSLGLPAIIIYILIQINNRLKNLEDKLKDK